MDEMNRNRMMMGGGLPPNATNSLYVDGIPIDASEREISHIFRQYRGYHTERLSKKESKFGNGMLYLCFVDFDCPENAVEIEKNLFD